MGADTRIYIPAYVKAKDIGEVCAVLCGNKVDSSGDFPVVDSFEVTTNDFSSGEMIGLSFLDPLGKSRHMSLFYEHSDVKLYNHKMISARSNFLWVGLGRKLVDIYGGKLDYNDGDNVSVDYEVLPKDAILKMKLFDEFKDSGYYARKDFLKSLPPLSLGDLEYGAENCAYGKTDDFDELYMRFAELGMIHLDKEVDNVRNSGSKKCKKV